MDRGVTREATCWVGLRGIPCVDEVGLLWSGTRDEVHPHRADDLCSTLVRQANDELRSATTLHAKVVGVREAEDSIGLDGE